MKRFLLLILPFLLVSCTGYNKLLKKGTMQEKYDAAKLYYNKKDYGRAAPLFEELSRAYRGRKEAEELNYYYAYCQYGMGEYMLSSYLFKNYVETYPRGSHSEESAYMYAYCEYLRSLPMELDQTSTKGAMEALQLFINLYPSSSFVAEANQHIDELRVRIVNKAYHNAKLWYDIGDYKAAMTACTNAVEDYPDISQKDELLFLAFKAAYIYAKNSVEELQKERFTKALEYYENFKIGSGTSEFGEEAEKLKKKITSELAEIKNS